MSRESLLIVLWPSVLVRTGLNSSIAVTREGRVEDGTRTPPWITKAETPAAVQPLVEDTAEVAVNVVPFGSLVGNARRLVVRGLILFSALVFSLFSWPQISSAQTESSDLLTPSGSTTIPFSFGQGTFARWSGGTLVVVQDRFSRAPTFRVFDREGREISRHTFTIPDAAHINAYAFARGGDGSLVVGGTAFTRDSRGASFLAWVSQDRSAQTTIRTSPFVISAVTVAADGTIWVAGHRKRNSADEPWDYTQHLIRRYDKTGKLLGSYVPWSSLEAPVPRTSPPDNLSQLVSSADRVGWYSPRLRTYVEFALDGTVLRKVKGPDHNQHDIVSLGLCDDGSLFLSVSILAGPGKTRSWSLFALEREREMWNYLPQKEPWGAMYGCDGTRLAITTDPGTIAWLEVSERNSKPSVQAR